MFPSAYRLEKPEEESNPKKRPTPLKEPIPNDLDHASEEGRRIEDDDGGVVDSEEDMAILLSAERWSDGLS